jgi:hypothetical protein
MTIMKGGPIVSKTRLSTLVALGWLAVNSGACSSDAGNTTHDSRDSGPDVGASGATNSGNTGGATSSGGATNVSVRSRPFLT